MTRTLTLVVAAVLVLAGVVFTLQGLNLLTGAAMSGQVLWVVLGPLIAIAGVYLAVRTLRPRAVGGDV